MPFVNKDDLEKLVTAGSAMSNACFNLKQMDRFTEQDRQVFENLQQRWDEAKRVVACNARSKK